MQEWILPLLNIAVLVIIFLVSERNRASGFGPYDFFSGGNNRFAQERSRFAADRGVIYLFWSAGCHFCQELKKGAWPMFLVRAKNSGIAVHEVEMRENMSVADQQLVQQAGPMRGVPYIVRMAPGQAPEPFNGPRTDEALMLWALKQN